MKGLFALCAGIAAGLSATAATREVYVWQRQSGPELTESLRAFATRVDGFCVLAAEVGWKAGRMTVFRPKSDLAMLRNLGRPVGLALRMGPFGGSFASDDATAGALGTVAREILAEAQAAGLDVAELQIDFDCAESKLAGYRAWLTALRAAVGRRSLVFTALPAWLKHKEFAVLARAADGFVLQVHSLEKPAGPDAPFTLCDPEHAWEWAGQADRIGVPFRVALPTYGYSLAFDAGGRFVALGAEGPQLDLPAGGQRRIVRADASAMARLANRLAADPPAHCTGVIWFRLPVASDRLNWDAGTLAVVLRGEIPESRLELQVARPEQGLAEIVLVNTGQTTEALPVRIDVRAEGARLLAADGLGGFRLETIGGRVQAIIRAAGASEEASLAPGGRMPIAWLRHAHEIPIVVTLPSSHP